jgi:hypothetical protein
MQQHAGGKEGNQQNDPRSHSIKLIIFTNAKPFVLLALQGIPNRKPIIGSYALKSP